MIIITNDITNSQDLDRHVCFFRTGYSCLFSIFCIKACTYMIKNTQRRFNVSHNAASFNRYICPDGNPRATVSITPWAGRRLGSKSCPAHADENTLLYIDNRNSQCSPRGCCINIKLPSLTRATVNIILFVDMLLLSDNCALGILQLGDRNGSNDTWVTFS